MKINAIALPALAATAEALLNLDLLKLPSGVQLLDLDIGPSSEPPEDCIDVWHPPHHGVDIDGCDNDEDDDWHWVHPGNPVHPDQPDHVWTHEVVTATHVNTVIACPDYVADCPGGDRNTHVSTVYVPETTTLYPVPATGDQEVPKPTGDYHPNKDTYHAPAWPTAEWAPPKHTPAHESPAYSPPKDEHRYDAPPAGGKDNHYDAPPAGGDEHVPAPPATGEYDHHYEHDTHVYNPPVGTPPAEVPVHPTGGNPGYPVPPHTPVAPGPSGATPYYPSPESAWTHPGQGWATPAHTTVVPIVTPGVDSPPATTPGAPVVTGSAARNMLTVSGFVAVAAAVAALF